MNRGVELMLIGNPDKFAFLLEVVPEWCSGNFVNGLLYVYINGEQYPKTIRTTTLSDDIYFLLNKSPFVNPKRDDELYLADTRSSFARLCEITFPEDLERDNDYSYLLPLVELENARYNFFIVASEKKVKILVGYYGEIDKMSFVDEVEIEIQEFERVKQLVQDYYVNVIKNRN